MTKYNFKKKNSGINYVKEILAKKHSNQKHKEILDKHPNPLVKPNKNK
jgi:hypothetical protein